MLTQQFNIEEGAGGRFAGVRVGNKASLHLLYINIAYGAGASWGGHT